MSWKWYEITGYRVAVGSESGDYYAAVQLMGPAFYALLKFRKSGSLPAASAPAVASTQRFYGYLDFQQLPAVVDLLRNESPVRFGWYDAPTLTLFQLMTGEEPVGEGDGTLAQG